jgi:hypothetical protein
MHMSKIVYKQPGPIQYVLRASRHNSIPRDIPWDPRTHAPYNHDHKSSEAGPCWKRTAPWRQGAVGLLQYRCLLILLRVVLYVDVEIRLLNEEEKPIEQK